MKNILARNKEEIRKSGRFGNYAWQYTYKYEKMGSSCKVLTNTKITISNTLLTREL